MTFAILKSFGTIPLENDILIKYSRGSDMTDLTILRTKIGILKEPTALLDLNLLISCSISPLVVGEIKKLFLIGIPRYSVGVF
jgi:hypothetical protein